MRPVAVRCDRCEGDGFDSSGDDCTQCEASGTYQFVLTPWQPGSYGKGYLLAGAVEHWQIDSKGAGTPHHIDAARALGDATGAADFDCGLLRFDIEPDGTVSPVVDCLAQRWRGPDYLAVMSAHAQFRGQAEAKTVGYGHAVAMVG